MSTIYGNAIILPSKGENTSGGAGFNVTFPATATNWNQINSAGIIQVDGTVVRMEDY